MSGTSPLPFAPNSKPGSAGFNAAFATKFDKTGVLAGANIPFGSTSGTVADAAIYIQRDMGVRPEDYGAVADGVTDDAAAFLAAGIALGARGGDIRLQLGKRYRISTLTLPDYVSIRGHMRPGMPSSTAYNYNFNLTGSTLVVDSTLAATGVTSADAPAFSVALPFSTLPAGVALAAPVVGPGIQPGTIITAVNANSIGLSIPSQADTPAGSTITFGSVGITLGTSGYIYDALIVKTGIVTPPVSATSAQNEINSWLTGGTAINAGADSCGVIGCFILGFAVCIGAWHGHRQVFDSTSMDGYSGLSIASTGDLFFIERMRFEPYFTIQLPMATTSPLLAYRPGTAFMIGTNCNDTTPTNCFSFCAGVGFWVQDSLRVSLLECFSDANTAYIGPGIAPIGFYITGTSLQCRIQGRASGQSYGARINLTATPGGIPLDNGATLIEMSCMENVVADYQCDAGGMILDGAASWDSLGFPVVAGPLCNHLELWHIDFSHSHSGQSAPNAFNIDPAALPFTTRVGGRIQNYVDNLGEQLVANANRTGGMTTYMTFSGGSLAFPQGFITPSMTLGSDIQLSPTFFIDGVSGHNRQVVFQTASSNRWVMSANGAVENGSNAGSDFQLDAWSDTNTLISTCFKITRATGAVIIPTSIQTGLLTVGTDAGATAKVVIDTAAGSTKQLVYETASSTRWVAYSDGAAESGSNAGSNYRIDGYSDAGSTLGTYFEILRSTGATTVSAPLLTLGGSAISSPTFTINGIAGHNRQITYQSGGSLRWDAYVDGVAEGGSNVGSSYKLDAYSDAGAFLWNALLISRTDGQPFFPQGITVGPSVALAITATTGFLQIPFVAGAPTGIPTSASKGVALVYDTTNHKLWAYDNSTSTWKGVALT